MQFSFAKMHTMLSQLREKSCNSQDAHRQSIVEVRVNQRESFCSVTFEDLRYGSEYNVQYHAEMEILISEQSYTIHRYA